MSIYDFTVKNSKKEDVSLAEYKGKVLLVVNTATGCGFTPAVKPEDIDAKIKELL